MTFISTLGQAMDQIERVKTIQSQLADFQTQLASGKKTTLFKGLGADVLGSQRARASLGDVDAYMNNITIANRRLSLMTNAIDEIKAQAGNLEGAIRGQISEGDFDLSGVKELADNIFNLVTSLVNEKDGDRYLFGGSETTTQPLRNTGLLDTYANSQVDDWINNTITTDQLIDNYHDRNTLTDTLVGYSSTLSGAKNVFVRVDDQSEVNYTTLANDDPFRNILAATGMARSILGSLDKIRLDSTDPASTVVPPGATNDDRAGNFFQVWNDLAATIGSAIDGLDQEKFNISQVQAQIAQISDEHKTGKNMLQNTISDIEDADSTEVALNVNQLQIQLEASFRVTASLSGLTLANFLG